MSAPAVMTDKSVWRPPGGRWRATLTDGRGAGVAEGFGPTAKAAKDALMERVCSILALAGEEPMVFRATDALGVMVYAQEGRWHYRILRGLAPGAAASGRESCQETEIHARRHLAQDMFDPADPEAGDGGMSVIAPDDREGRMEHARWLTWQRAYASARRRGLGDGPAREEADRA